MSTFPTWFADPLKAFITPFCFTTLLENHEFFNAVCLKTVAVKMIGLLIILGSVLVKVC